MTLSIPAGVTLYFARHGETEANIARWYSGRGDTPLTANGRAQAHQIGLTLKRDVPGFAALDYVSSPLQRARTTMEIARRALGLAADAYRVVPRIAEIDLGRWDQRTVEQARAMDPNYFARRAADKWDVPAPDGESYRDVAARLSDWVQGLRRDTFAVSHGAAIRILRGLLGGLDVDAMSILDEPQGVVFKARDAEVTMLPAAGGAVSNPQPIG